MVISPNQESYSLASDILQSQEPQTFFFFNSDPVNHIWIFLEGVFFYPHYTPKQTILTFSLADNLIFFFLVYLLCFS